MEDPSFILLNLNASRIRNEVRIKSILNFIMSYEASLVCIQEIHIVNALRVFSGIFQVYVNIETNSNDGIGIITLVKNGIKVSDQIIGLNGRIIGLKIECVQLWNVYPQSGSEHKRNRETFFRETLCNLMMNWKDHSKFIIESGDHNCIHRLTDSENNSNQHFQPALVKHLKIHGLSDEFLNIHGQDAIMFSRVTNRSKTRIDYVFSNSNQCSYFQYVNPDLGLDHAVMVARFDIPLVTLKSFIPRDRFFRGWVISKSLENDTEFLSEAKIVVDSIKEESMGDHSAELDPSFFWLKLKSALRGLAMKREREMKKEETQHLEILKGFYSSIVRDIKDGLDCFEELADIKNQLDAIYKKKAVNMVDKMRCLQIDDGVYDIHKLQNQKKYENQGKIKELKIGEKVFKGTEEVVRGIVEKMSKELESHSMDPVDGDPTPAELPFLNKLRRIELSEEEEAELLKPTDEEEIEHILKYEVDMDSSPGEDGITYRFIFLLWKKVPSYRFLFLDYLNFTRESGSCGILENCRIMVIKNKKLQSTDYEKKRKLTKLNKDSNLGNGKVWTNRLKRIIIPKILPQNQFSCQNSVNIIDEICEIKQVNTLLLGNGGVQQDGTILSIDFKDAFRSMSHRWFNLVLKFLGIPSNFIKWFWSMYADLSVAIVLNKFKSDNISVKRGFMEGHPPSMAAFVIGLIPMMQVLEERLGGIEDAEGRTHRIKLFADDMKVFMTDVSEIDCLYTTISEFENVSGLMMHRDPARGKCQALPFGSHRDFQDWPEWVTVRSSMKIVGVIFSNSESLEKINSELVLKSFNDKLHASYGIRGTILQKVYFVNTFLFSKLWYVAQCFMIEKKIISQILKIAMKFIYAGENERPVQVVNFRARSAGGLGLVNPSLKCMALLIRTMLREFRRRDVNPTDLVLQNQIYGYRDEFQLVIRNDLVQGTTKQIYSLLLQEIISKNGSFIPSRNEKRSLGVKWSISWKNMSLVRGLNPEERCFVWKLIQDMIPVGARIHRNNAEKRCLAALNDGVCQAEQTLVHCLQLCPGIQEIHNSMINILSIFLDREVTSQQLITLSFNQRSKKKLKCALWFAVKVMFLIFQEKIMNKAQMLMRAIKEIDWNLKLCRNVGSHADMISLRVVIDENR